MWTSIPLNPFFGHVWVIYISLPWWTILFVLAFRISWNRKLVMLRKYNSCVHNRKVIILILWFPIYITTYENLRVERFCQRLSHMNAENLQHLYYELTINDQIQSIKLIVKGKFITKDFMLIFKNCRCLK